MNNIRVTPIIGNPNQLHILTDDSIYFESNGALLVRVDSNDGQVYLNPNWDSNPTRIRYTAKFLGASYLTIVTRIMNGHYLIA